VRGYTLHTSAGVSAEGPNYSERRARRGLTARWQDGHDTASREARASLSRADYDPKPPSTAGFTRDLYVRSAERDGQNLDVRVYVSLVGGLGRLLLMAFGGLSLAATDRRYRARSGKQAKDAQG